MRRITVWLVATVAVVVLLFSYRTSTGGPRFGTVSVAPAAPAGVVSGSRATARSGTMTVNGSVVPTQWGPVQVQIKIAEGRIADITVLRKPSGSPMERAVTAFALPQLRSQVLAAQNAKINGVSGATVTTAGYKRSLQAAITAANFGGAPSGVAPPVQPMPPSLAPHEDD